MARSVVYRKNWQALMRLNTMKRFSSLALAFALIVPVGFVGCGDEATDQVEITQETPSGETTETLTKEVETSGENPPAPVVTDPAASPAAAPE